jgi:hypothetical protein
LSIWNESASFAHVVVLPDPCVPQTITTAGPADVSVSAARVPRTRDERPPAHAHEAQCGVRIGVQHPSRHVAYDGLGGRWSAQCRQGCRAASTEGSARCRKPMRRKRKGEGTGYQRDQGKGIRGRGSEEGG